MLKFLVRFLSSKGLEVNIAYYKPYSVAPSLSTPVFRLWQGAPGVVVDDAFEGAACTGVGCWLPELEFTHYWVSKRWRQLIDTHDLHLCVSGTCLAALHFAQTDTPFIAWIASDWDGDRAERVKNFSAPRRLLNDFLIAPVARAMEQKVLARGGIVALSDYTKNALNTKLSGDPVRDVVMMPIDTGRFSPVNREFGGTVGFVGRFEDPRKNTPLLLRAAARLTVKHPGLRVRLIGDNPCRQTMALVHKLGLEGRVEFCGPLTNEQIPRALESLDVFIVPSFQEGLCISALEAMSSGLPVISTRCGGPECYIEDGQNGRLVSFEVEDMADAISELFEQPALRQKYARAARATVLSRFSEDAAETKLWDLLCSINTVLAT